MIQKEFIRSELRYRYPNLQEQIRAPQQPVGRPLLFERGERKFGARIIVCDAAELNLMKSGTQTEPLFLCVGTPDTEVFDALDICVLPEHEQKSAVLNFVQRLFDRLDDWTQSLRQAAETGAELEELLTRASDMLQNPIALLDERGHIVAQSERMEASVIAPLANLIATQYDPMQYDPMHLSSVQKLGDASAPSALFTWYTAGESRYVLLCAATDRPLYASDEIVFDSLSGYLRLMLSQRALHLGADRVQRQNEAVARLLRELLSQEQPEQATLEHLAQLGWSDADEYAVLAIEPEDGVLRAARADALCDSLERKLDGSCAFTAASVIVAVLRVSFLKDDALIDQLRNVAGAEKLKIGVCEPLEGFSLLPQRLALAKCALNHAELFDGVSRFFDVIEAEIVSGSIAEVPKELICMRHVRAMAQFDLQHKTCYLQTAQQYVGHHFNAVRTAGALFIHRSTFLYRLERMRAQFGLDLDDEHLSLMHLLLSLNLARTIFS